MESSLLPATCSVCGPVRGKAGGSAGGVGLHYGAVTCYPCRQFFKRCGDRRARLPACRRARACATDASTQPEVWARQGRHCSGCRLQKCLQVGMDLDCVLNDQQRAARFAKSIGKRKRRGEDGEQSFEDMGSEPSMGSSPTSRDPNRASPEWNPQPSPSTSTCSVNPPRHVSTSSVSSPQPSPTISAESSHKHQRVDSSDYDQPPSLPEVLRLEIPGQRVSVIKKSLVLSPNSQNKPTPLNIQESQSGCIESTHQMVKKYWLQKHLLSSRSSVIVISPKLQDLGVGDFQGVPTNENENIAEENISSFVKLESEALTLINSQSIADLELAYLFDEFSIPFMEGRKKAFLASWHSLNLGEAAIGAYIEYCRTRFCRTRMPAGWLAGVSKIFRERYMKIAINMDLVEGVPQSSLLRVLGDRLHLTNILPWTFNCNVASAEAESEFCNGLQDQAQWRARGPGVDNLGTEGLLELLVPATAEAAVALQQFLHMLMVHKGSVFTDMSVHLMMMVLVVFDRADPCEQVRRVHRVAGDMLERYLRVVSRQPAADLHLVLACVAMVPTINNQLDRLFGTGQTKLPLCQ